MGPRLKLLACAFALTTCATCPWMAWMAQAHAEPLAGTQAPERRKASLQWVREPGAEGCVDGAELARRVEAKLGRSVFEAARDANLIIEGRAERRAEGYRAELRTFEAATAQDPGVGPRPGAPLGSREVVSAQAGCEELSATVAVVLAVMIDPQGALGHVEPTPPPPPAPVIAPPPPPQPVQPPAAAPDTSRRTRPELSAFARAAYGHLPRWLWGGGAALELGFRRWGGARFEGAAFADRRLDLSGVPGAGTHVRVLYAGASYCPLWGTRGRLRGAGCVGALAGALQSRGFGFDVSKQGLSPLIDAAFSLRAALRLVGPLGLYFGGLLSVPLARTDLHASDARGVQHTLAEQGPLAIALDLGLGTSF
jgi:hypothetical protein